MSLYVLPLISAVLLALSFPKPSLTFLVWCAFLPWLYALRKQARFSHAFFSSYVAGIVFFSITLYWITYVSTLGFVVLTLYLALYFSLFASITWRLLRFPSVVNIFCIPAAWVTLEFLRSHFIMGFSWVLLGYSQYTILPIIQLSDFTGAYGVSFLIALVNVALFYFFSAELDVHSSTM